MFFYPARRMWAITLNLIGFALVADDLATRSLRGAPVLIAVAAWVACSLWPVVTLLPERWVRVRTPLYLLIIAGGSLAATCTDVVAYVPAVVGVLAITGAPALSWRVAAGAVAESVVLVAAGALIVPTALGSVIGVATALLFCGLGGLSRRQFRTSSAQEQALLEERVATAQERARVATLTERSRIARDLHDVLAHSLGGLVIQLEAVDALLESGRTDEARTRAQDARKLAVSGLVEARRAVTAQREPDKPLGEVVAALVADHRAMGGQIAVRGDADRGVLSPAGRDAVHRAVQELLTNARRHARGAPTTLDLDWDDGALTVTASTPTGLATDAASGSPPGGGHGLAGMRERVTAAGGTMTVRPGPPFEVVLHLPGAAPA